MSPFDLNTYEKARHSSVLFSLADWAKVEVRGADHAAFLHNILSQDILGMKTGEWREAALLSATSHVRAYFFTVKLQNSVLLLGPSQTADKIRELLDKFIISEDIQIHEAAADWGLFEAWGPETAAFIEKNAAHALIYKPEDSTGARTLILTKNSDKNFSDTPKADLSVRETLRIEYQILEFKSDFDESIMLSETRLEKKSASETKGCYPGQEVVAKIETYKRLNRSFVQLFFVSAPSAQPERGSEICSVTGEEIGRLTSLAYSPFFKKNVGLGWLRRGFFERPVEVSIKSETAIPANTTLFKN